MAGKLVRNTSDKESRAWWRAVEDAAASAVDLDVDEDADRKTGDREPEGSRPSAPK